MCTKPKSRGSELLKVNDNSMIVEVMVGTWYEKSYFFGFVIIRVHVAEADNFCGKKSCENDSFTAHKKSKVSRRRHSEGSEWIKSNWLCWLRDLIYQWTQEMRLKIEKKTDSTFLLLCIEFRWVYVSGLQSHTESYEREAKASEWLW